jgi:ATP-dependent Lon protease
MLSRVRFAAARIYFPKDMVMKNSKRIERGISCERNEQARKAMIDRTISEFNLVKDYENSLIVPANLLQLEKDNETEILESKSQSACLPADNSASEPKVAPISPPARKSLRPFRRCIRVFEPSEIERAKIFAKSSSNDTRKRVEAAVKIAEAHDGYRKIPAFRNIDRELAHLAKSFGNFQHVLDHYAEELILAGASKVEGFRIAPTLLDGEPGVGKTAFVQALASNLGLPFLKMSAGGMQHAAVLTGTAAHWGNSQTGVIFNLISHSQWATGVLMIDEADKLCDRLDYSILPALLDLLEPESARKFKDVSIELPFDASRLIVLMTSNKMSNMDAALLSRCRTFKIELPGFEQRTLIAMQVLDEINNALARNKRLEVDVGAVEKLAESDIDIRALIMAMRKACSRALRAGSHLASPELSLQKVTKRQIGFVQTESALAN